MDVYKLVEEREPERQNSPAKRDYLFCIVCFVLAVIFFGAMVLFLLNSSTKLDSKTSQVLGTAYVANFQNTVYAVGCGIISAIFAVGGMILAYLSGRD